MTQNTNSSSHPTASLHEGLSPLEERVARWRVFVGVGLALVTVVYAWAVVQAPVDSSQGIIQKILYVHPPLAYGAP